MIMEDLLAKQEKDVEEREKNLKIFGRRLPQTSSSQNSHQ